MEASGNELILKDIAQMGSTAGPQILQLTRTLYASRANRFGLHFDAAAAEVPYGPDPRHRLDIYRSSGSGSRPVLLFVPGGGFVGGGKSEHRHFYSNVGACFAAQGFLVAAMNYRLAPAHSWPAGSEDVLAALLWLQSNVAAFGGDPKRIAVLAQSAGATHVLGLLFHPRLAVSAPALRAVALLSGLYLLTESAPAGAHTYFGQRSPLFGDDPLTFSRESRPPLLLATAEFDPPFISEQASFAAERLRASRWKAQSMHRFCGHNHFSPVHTLGIQADEVVSTLTAFFGDHA